MQNYLDKIIKLRSEVFVIITMQSMIFWVVTLCYLDLLHLIGQSVCQARNQEKQTCFLTYYWTLRMEVICSSET
jgi:hypothetical protein